MSAKDLEALKCGIMAEIEAKLSQKEEQLWKRGQVELKRLQQDQQQAKEYIGKLQERQASLLSENKTIRGALVEVTSRFEVVVQEVREVLRALPQCAVNAPNIAASGGVEQAPQPSPSPSSVSTAASDEGLVRKAIFEEQTPGACSATTIGGSAERLGSWTATSELVASSLSVQDTACTSQTFCTPPRNSLASQDASFDGESHDAWPRTTSSPAVLSLADSLPPARTNSPPNPSPGTCKLLQLAECLDGKQATPGSAFAPPLPSSARLSEVVHSSASGVAKSSTTRQFDFITIEVVKEPGFQTLGVEVDQVDGVSLRVESIDKHGLLARHNAKQDGNAATCVQIGDRIIEVNGVRQDPAQMLNECKVRQRLSFTLARGACPTVSTPKVSSDIDTAVEDSPKSEENASKQVPSPPSPIESRLRPEASVFVPASQSMQEVQASPLVLPPVTVLPPGFDGFDTSGLLTLPTGTALGTQFASMLEAAGSTALASGAVCLPGAAPPPPPFMHASAGYEAEDEELKRALFP
jgi:hypothetical protein